MNFEPLTTSELDKIIKSAWHDISVYPHDEVAIVKYLKFLSDLYTNGFIGYRNFPYYILSILSLDNIQKLRSTNPKIQKILNLAVELDVPNHHLVNGKITRENLTKNLVNEISSI